MYSLSKRQSEIVNYLLDKENFVTIKQLADVFLVSSRTIRYDLDKIESWLEENEASLIRKPQKGIKVNSGSKTKALKQKLNLITPENRVLSQEEREKLILIEIYSEDSITLDDLCEKLWSSKGTVIKDIKKLQEKLKKFDIKICSRNRDGFHLEGNEEQIRRVVGSCIRDILNINDLVKIMDDKRKYELKIIEYISKHVMLISVNGMVKVFKILDEAEKYMNIKLADDAYAALAIHILIAIKRLENQHEIDIEKTRVQYLKDKKEYVVATYIAKRIEETFDITFMENEIANIALHLMGAKLYEDIEKLNSVESIDLRVDEEIVELNKKIICKAEEEIGIDLKEDNQLYKALLLHLKPAIYRIKNNMKISNPLLEEIKSRYSFIYQAAVKCSEIIREYLNRDIPQNEIGYIAMHLGAAFEKNYNAGYLVQAIVVCTSGLATSQLLSIRLKNLLPELKIVATCSIKDMDKYKDKAQIIISTVDFKYKDLEVIKVSPFLNEKDLKKIRKQIYKICQLNKFVHFTNVNVCGIKNIKESDPMLKDVLTEKNVRLKVEVNNWEEAIKEAGDILVKNGHVNTNYVDSMINSVKEFGPYIVIMPGVAFAHARPCEDVKEPCMSLATLKNPVIFGCGENDPVSIVFAFGAVNQNGHLTALQDLARFLEKEENIEFLKNADDPEVVIKNIIQYENSINI